MEQPRPHRQIQADELCLNTQKGKVWVAMASVTRLWLGAQVSRRRSKKLIGSLMQQVARCCIGPVLVVTDGLITYAKATLRAFRQPVRSGQRGAPRLALLRTVVLAQVVNYTRKGKRYICHGVNRCRVLLGTFRQLGDLLEKSTGKLLNTAYIERFNATLRHSLAACARRSRNLWRKPDLVKTAVYWMGTYYNFFRPHASLSQHVPTTPAMAAAITNHCWSVEEFLRYKIPPPAWKPPPKQGRPSKATLEMVKNWSAFDHG